MIRSILTAQLIALMGCSRSDPATPDPARAGEQSYIRVCSACHQVNGQGLPGVFPPLAGSEWVAGDPARSIKIVLHGLKGPIEVNNAPYNAMMMPQGGILSDAEIADVLTYVRSSWGNNDDAVSAAQVTAIRSATDGRTTPWSAEELSPQ